MGKAHRERARRGAGLRPSPVDERPLVAPAPGAAFGLTPDYHATWTHLPTTTAAPIARSRSARAGHEPSPDILRRVQRADVVRDALENLRQLATMRAEARGVVVRHDEQIRSAVAHVRLDGVSWSQIGTALGISRQGARQRFGADSQAPRQVPTGSANSRTPRTPPEAWSEPLAAALDEEESEWKSSRL